MADDIIISEAPEVEEIALELIPQYHPHLAEASIRYLKSTQDRKSKGKSVAAHMGKFNRLDRYLASGTSADLDEGEEYYLIVYDAFREFTAAQRRACVDHELCHLVVTKEDEITDEQTLGFVGHDVEEFAAVIQRHGLWNVEIQEFELKARQMSLDAVLLDANRRTAEGLVLMAEADAARQASEVPEGVMASMRKMDRDARRDGISMTFSTNDPGMEPVTIGARGRGAE